MPPADPKSQNLRPVLLCFALCTALLFPVFHGFTNLHDADGYFHLATARLYSQNGFVDHLDWTRFSIMHGHFGDKEFLFHVLLIPFVSLLPFSIGVPLASSLLAALVLTTIYHLSRDSIGLRAWIVPFWLFTASADLAGRLTQLRPELIAIILFMFITRAAARKKYARSFILSALYCLCYTAYQAPVVFSILWTLTLGILYKEWDFRIALYVLTGALAGIILHPGFPSNVIVWYYQHVKFLQFHTTPTLPLENFPESSAEIARNNIGWIFGLWLLWRSGEKAAEKKTGAFREQIFFTINALVFLLLFLSMRRFALYAIPFVTLVVFFTMQKQGMVLGARTRLPGGRTLPFGLTCVLLLLLGLYGCRQTRDLLTRHGVYAANYQKNWDGLRRNLKDHAKVAASTLSSHSYIWAAPQAEYLCVLDEVFMASLYPDVYVKQSAIWTGKEPDVPLTVKTYLDSDFVAFTHSLQTEQLYQRLTRDPRAQIRQDGLIALFELRPGAENFVRDWTVLPPYLKMPLATEKAHLLGAEYPRPATKTENDFGGFIDGHRIDPSAPAAGFVHFEETAAPVTAEYELSCYGPCSFWHNGRLVVESGTPAQAILGKGMTFTLHLTEGANIFTVQTSAYHGYLGFYLLRR